MQRAPEYQAGQAVPGTVYRVHRVLGAGGMGTVYDVEDTSVGKRYVLKTLHGDLADRSDLAARLAREARALAKLQHPNIVEVYTSGTTQDSLRLPYYVMERLQGQSLRTVLERKGRLTVEQALDIGIDLLDALDHAHEFGIIHRDVKPDNIFITRGRDGRSLAKLLDFGIIKLATGPTTSATLATGGRFIGTFRYAPPEQILGREVTPRSDLYAAGLVIYEMMAGRGPFDDFTGEMEIGKAHIDIPSPTLSRFATVPVAVEQLVMSALEKDAALRPRDAFTFASSLRELKKQRASSAPISSNTSAATVEQVVAQPASAARPATPFGAQPTHAEIVPMSGPETRIDAPAGKHAATAAAAEIPLSNRSQTLSLGVRPQGGQPETFAAAPLTMHAPTPQAAPPIDRRAETHEAAPQPIQRPHYDTAPIPLAVLARPESNAPLQNETFGAHTTGPSQRKKSSRTALVTSLAGLVVIGAVGVGALVVWKQKQKATTTPVTTTTPTTTTPTTVTTTTTTATTSAAIDPPITPVTAMTDTASAIVTTTTATVTAPVADTISTLPIAHTTHTATATTTSIAAPPPPTHTASAVVTPTPQPTATATATHHRPGSGL